MIKHGPHGEEKELNKNFKWNFKKKIHAIGIGHWWYHNPETREDVRGPLRRNYFYRKTYRGYRIFENAQPVDKPLMFKFVAVPEGSKDLIATHHFDDLGAMLGIIESEERFERLTNPNLSKTKRRAGKFMTKAEKYLNLIEKKKLDITWDEDFQEWWVVDQNGRNLGESKKSLMDAIRKAVNAIPNTRTPKRCDR